LARGVARIALNPPEQTKVYYAGHLRRFNKREEMRGKGAQEERVDEEALPFE
jgi:hypothetical protein